MAEITAAMVKALRDETAQGMMACKKALVEADGDLQAAKDLLRARGLVKAENKAVRAASEGLIEIITDEASATMIEVSCETDFCARNDVFKATVAAVAKLAAAAEPGEIAATEAITSTVQGAFEKIGENMSYVRGVKLTGEKVGTYKHHNSKVGAVVAIEGQLDPAVLGELCMHVAFHAPMGIDESDIPAETIEHEKAVAKAQAVEQGKPEAIAEKMVVGKVRKFIQQNCLLSQPFVKDEDRTVREVLGGAKVLAFTRYQVGEAAATDAE